MEKFNHILVVCVDRDDDFGRKAKIIGPVIGREACIKAATKLGINDPEDSDMNCLFGAIKQYDELKKKNPNIEIACLTGKNKLGFESDKNIIQQLDNVLEDFPADGFILVTDGAEDDQVIPLLQNRAKIISKKTIFVKQAKEVESTFYTIKEALKDPYLARVAFGIPGIILLLLFAIPSIGLQLILFVAGFYLLLKGFGIEERIVDAFQTIITSISTQRTSFPFYLSTLFILGFGVISAFTFYQQNLGSDLLMHIVETSVQFLFFVVIASIVFNIGRALDVIQIRKAFLLKNYFKAGVSAILIWFIIDAGRQVFIGRTDLNMFMITTIISFVVLYLAFKASNVFDIRKKVTKLLIGMPVYNDKGKWIGIVDNVNRQRQSIEVIENKTKEVMKLKRKEFNFRPGRIMLAK